VRERCVPASDADDGRFQVQETLLLRQTIHEREALPYRTLLGGYHRGTDQILSDIAPDVGLLISRREIDKFENC
jgi:hypothetical protein